MTPNYQPFYLLIKFRRDKRKRTRQKHGHMLRGMTSVCVCGHMKREQGKPPTGTWKLDKSDASDKFWSPARGEKAIPYTGAMNAVSPMRRLGVSHLGFTDPLSPGKRRQVVRSRRRRFIARAVPVLARCI